MSANHDIILQLQKDILPLQGFKPPSAGIITDVGLGPITAAFPNAIFPTGAIHEFLSTAPEQAAASGGFIAGILSSLMSRGGVTIWISQGRTLFPPALKGFGIEPDKLIFVDVSYEKDVLRVMEEALKCEGLAAVVGELRDLSHTASRRLQLAVEQSRVTGFLLRHQPRNLSTAACVARWRITAVPSELEAGVPGVGFPRWRVELLKVRNGRPGQWEVEWAAGRFGAVEQEQSVVLGQGLEQGMASGQQGLSAQEMGGMLERGVALGVGQDAGDEFGLGDGLGLGFEQRGASEQEVEAGFVEQKRKIG
jgi:protein ImuA